MDASDRLAALAADARRELTGHILPYWMRRAVDDTRGGFVGRIAGDDRVVTSAPRGAVLNARLLWTFAAVARTLADARYTPFATRAFDYLRAHFADPNHGGVYWTVTADGEPLDTKKQTYAQAFALYGLAEYVRLTDSSEARTWAIDLFHLLEERAVDPVHGGYLEAFARDWSALGDVRLSARDLDAPKSMNTHLHVLEAYTNLYRVWPNAVLAGRLEAILTLYLDRIVDDEKHRQHGFFGMDWTPLPSPVSYGHDIEASWLLLEAAEEIGQARLVERVRKTAVSLARQVLHDGVDADGGVFYERHLDGRLDADKHWWPQAEAVVGFVNAYALTDDEAFLDAAARAWHFVQHALVDAENGEWFYRVARDGTPYRSEDKVGIWKCPYHNARACLEVMQRARQAIEAVSAR